MKSDFVRGKTFKSNEDYKGYLLRQNRIFIGYIAIGFLTTVIITLAEFSEGVKKFITIDEYMKGVYEGVGVALLVIGVVKLIRNLQIIRNEEKLAEMRRGFGDERLREISKTAMRFTAWVMIFGMYLFSLIGGFFYPLLAKVLMIVVCIFLVLYVVSYRVLEKRM